jgi:hypothetical protein
MTIKGDINAEHWGNAVLMLQELLHIFSTDSKQ